MSKPRVVVTNGEVPAAAIQHLATECELVICDELPYSSRKDILRRLPGARGIFWVTKERMDAEVLDAAGPDLQVVSSMSAGYDHIDVPAARSRGIALGHTPGVLANAVAEVALMLALAAARRLTAGQRAMQRGCWETGRPQWLLGHNLSGRTAGIVGFGGIGQATAQFLQGFQVARILCTNRSQSTKAVEMGVEQVPLDELLQNSDFVFVSCPLTPSTKHLFNKATFSKMKQTAVFINTSRGDIVDQEALIHALRNGVIFAAGLDVMTPEPLPPDHELMTLDNCVLAPHIGSATVQTREDMALLAAKNLIAALKGNPMPAPIP